MRKLLTLLRAWELIVEMKAQHIWTEAELRDAVEHANAHPTSSPEGLFTDWVSYALQSGADGTAEAESAGLSVLPPRGWIIRMDGSEGG